MHVLLWLSRRVAVMMVVTSAAATAQTITLARAVEAALEKNPARKAVLAETRAAATGVREARSYFLPRVTFSETFARSNDPVFVFGTKLRQERFTMDDFALPALNTPSPINNWGTRFGAGWQLFDSGATWHGLRRAEDMKRAADRGLERSDQELVFRVVQEYVQVLLAARQVEVAEQGVKTAGAILTRSRDRVEAGLAVESDRLSSQVNLASRQQELIRARNGLLLARAQLAIAMGMPAESQMTLAEVLAERQFPAPSLAGLEAAGLARRPDLKRAEAEQAAQARNVRMTRAAFGPRVNAFAAWEADNRKFTGEGGNNWTAGIALELDLFQGGAKAARLTRERALQEKASAMLDVARDNVRLDIRRAYYDLDAARQQVEVARAATAQAQESLRILQDRYGAGLTTITDMLRGEEAARRAQSEYWQAVYLLHTSYASLELAIGTLDAQSAVVTQ